jgi:hypothetical protein
MRNHFHFDEKSLDPTTPISAPAELSNYQRPLPTPSRFFVPCATETLSESEILRWAVQFCNSGNWDIGVGVTQWLPGEANSKLPASGNVYMATDEKTVVVRLGRTPSGFCHGGSVTGDPICAPQSGRIVFTADLVTDTLKAEIWEELNGGAAASRETQPLYSMPLYSMQTHVPFLRQSRPMAMMWAPFCTINFVDLDPV